MKCSLQTIHLLQTHLGLLRTITMQQEAFVLQHTDTCFSRLDIIAILPLFSIGATSISVAALSELSEAPGRLEAPLYRGLCEALAQDAAEDERSQDQLSPKTPSSSLHRVSPHRFDVKLQLQHRRRTTLEVDGDKLILAASAASTIYFNDALKKKGVTEESGSTMTPLHDADK